MSPLASSTPFLNASEQCECNLPAASFALPAGSTAIVYCEGLFGEQDGKTANGLVRHSEKYEILSVIDSLRAGVDAGKFLDGTANGIPVLASLAESISHAGRVPDYLICGLAPADGLLSNEQRVVLLDGIDRGMHIVNGLHEFLNDDIEFAAAAAVHDVEIYDIRRPRAKTELHMFSGRIHEVTCRAFRGARHRRRHREAHHGDDPHERAQRRRREGGVGRHRADVPHPGGPSTVSHSSHGPCAVRHRRARSHGGRGLEGRTPDLIIVEGQGALSHPTYLSWTAILRGSLPAGVILQHTRPRARPSATSPTVPMPTVVSEINLIETFGAHRGDRHHDQPEGEHDRRRDLRGAIAGYEEPSSASRPPTPSARPTDTLLDMVFHSVPHAPEGPEPAVAR